ncbi:MAG TPA: MJ0042-type zinc finger domain-containing protein [Fimbriiglobus sp.]|nr:MJ0042-type zinc finger domain-containing protein [Fimbriiglobus sp.]
MIRFSCPGCGATYSVDDSKGGKTGKCPKCQTQFQIPMPEGAATPPAAGSAPAPSLPPPPPADPNAPVEIAPCPGCQARLSVAASDLGADVECPYCKTVYKAKKPGTGVAPVPSPRSESEDDRPRRRRDEEEDEDDRPSRRRRRDEDEEDADRPRRRRRDEGEADEDRPSRRRRDEDEEEDRPRRRRLRRGGSYEPHRGGLILTLGILSLVICGIFTGIPAWVMGNADLRKIDEGRMDPEGRTMTNVGRILGMINVILTCVLFVGYCLLFAIIGIGGAGKR